MEIDIKSLTDLFDDGIADLGLIDNCELGVDFLNHVKRVMLLGNHDVNFKQLKEAVCHSRKSLEFLQQYTQVGVTAEILAESAEKVRLTSRYVTIREKYEYKKKFSNIFQCKTGIETHRSRHSKKEKSLIERILENEQRIQSLLQQRVWSSDDKEAQAYKSLVIGAWKYLGNNGETKNKNDEKLVAAAMYLAVKQDKYVCIITADARIVSIVGKTQRALHTLDIAHILRITEQPPTTVSFDKLRQRLEEGKVMVVTTLPTRTRYEVEYCSADFYQRRITHAPVQTRIQV